MGCYTCTPPPQTFSQQSVHLYLNLFSVRIFQASIKLIKARTVRTKAIDTRLQLVIAYIMVLCVVQTPTSKLMPRSDSGSNNLMRIR